MRRMFIEYVKFVFAKVRMGLSPDPEMRDAS
jgi:hypothetical protein